MPQTDFLDHLVSCVSPDYAELSERSDAALSVSAALRGLLPYFDDFKVFGSITRHTGLSTRIDDSSDIDILCVMSFETYKRLFADPGGLEHVVPSMFGKLLVAEEEFSDIRTDRPCIDLRYRGFAFQLFPTLYGGQQGDDGTREYVFGRHSTDWRTRNAEDLGRYEGPGLSYNDVDVPKDDDAPDPHRLESTWPFRFNAVASQYDQLFGNNWRSLIILLKYWNFVNGKAMSSYVIEYNVMHALYAVARFSSCVTTFDYLHTFLSDTKLYHFDLFQREASFVRLVEHVERAKIAFDEGDPALARQLIENVLPFPPQCDRKGSGAAPTSSRGTTEVRIRSTVETEKTVALNHQRLGECLWEERKDKEAFESLVCSLRMYERLTVESPDDGGLRDGITAVCKRLEEMLRTQDTDRDVINAKMMVALVWLNQSGESIGEGETNVESLPTDISVRNGGRGAN